MDSEHKPGIFVSIFLLPVAYGTALRNDILRLEARQLVLKSSFAKVKRLTRSSSFCSILNFIMPREALELAQQYQKDT